MSAAPNQAGPPAMRVGAPYQLVRARHGWLLANANDFYLGQAVLGYGECCEHEVAFLKQLTFRPGRLVEVGANAGFLTLPLAKALALRGETLDVFEPQPFLFQNLCANLALNGLTNVRAWPFACGEERGVVSFPAVDYMKPGNFGGIAMQAQPTADRTERLNAPCVRLDDFLGDVSVGLIKVDVEGFEVKVLRGATGILTKSRPVLYVENDRAENSRALIEHLWATGYRLFWHTPPLFNRDNFSGRSENIYGNVASFNMLGLPTGLDVTVNGTAEIRDASVHPLALKQG